MSIKKIISTNIVTVDHNDPLSKVKGVFDQHNFHHLLVVNGTKLVGLVSDRDLLRTVSPFVGTMVESYRDTATLDNKVSEIMSTQLITLMPDADIYAAVDLFNQHRISCIPIVDEEFNAVGILSWRDIMKALAIVHRQKTKSKD